MASMHTALQDPEVDLGWLKYLNPMTEGHQNLALLTL